MQCVYICNIMQITCACQCNDRRFSKALDIHCIAADKVQDVVLHLCGASRILTLHIRRICFTYSMGATNRAYIRNHIGLRILRTFVRHHCFDARYDLPRFVDENRVAETHIQTVDIILVVQGRSLDACTAELHGIEHCRGRNAPCPSDGQLNIAENRLLFLGRIFVGNRPARCLCRCAELLTLGKVIDLDDGTVDVVGKFPAPCTNRRNCVPDLICCMADLIVCNDLDALCTHKIIGIGM